MEKQQKLNIKRPEDLHFPVHPLLASAINQLIEGLETNSPYIDCLLDEVQGHARLVDDVYDEWINHYYVKYGWAKNG